MCPNHLYILVVSKYWSPCYVATSMPQLQDSIARLVQKNIRLIVPREINFSLDGIKLGQLRSSCRKYVLHVEFSILMGGIKAMSSHCNILLFQVGP